MSWLRKNGRVGCFFMGVGLVLLLCILPNLILPARGLVAARLPYSCERLVHPTLNELPAENASRDLWEAWIIEQGGTPERSEAVIGGEVYPALAWEIGARAFRVAFLPEGTTVYQGLRTDEPSLHQIIRCLGAPDRYSAYEFYGVDHGFRVLLIYDDLDMLFESVTYNTNHVFNLAFIYARPYHLSSTLRFSELHVGLVDRHAVDWDGENVSLRAWPHSLRQIIIDKP